MPLRVPFPHVAVAATILACRAAPAQCSSAVESGTTDASASQAKTLPLCHNVPDFRCDVEWARDVPKKAIVEHHIGAYLFCYYSLELESKDSIEIKDSKEWGEHNEWLLSVGGIALHVRQDTEWTNMEAHGWRPLEIERVQYREASGRSARRLTRAQSDARRMWC